MSSLEWQKALNFRQVVDMMIDIATVEIFKNIQILAWLLKILMRRKVYRGTVALEPNMREILKNQSLQKNLKISE